MALTLGFHIVLACLGVGLPLLLLFAEWRHLRTGDPQWKILARRWSKCFAVLFAVGAVSGTMLSFELGLLWPGFMAKWGAVIGLPFTLEAFAFFLEAIFLEYLRAPAQLPAEYRRRLDGEGPERVICDYLAGMTDRYCLKEYQRLFVPFADGRAFHDEA